MAERDLGKEKRQFADNILRRVVLTDGHQFSVESSYDVQVELDGKYYIFIWNRETPRFEELPEEFDPNDWTLRERIEQYADADATKPEPFLNKESFDGLLKKHGDISLNELSVHYYTKEWQTYIRDKYSQL